MNESRRQRALRLGRISWHVLAADRRLLVFPAISAAISFLVGAVAFGLAAHWIGIRHRATFLVASLIATYPLTFITTMFGVALAAMLVAHLSGEPVSLGAGWRQARQRAGIIAVWTLMACTVGTLLTLLSERVPLGGKIAAWLVDVSWSLATLFAIPVLAYENLGPIATLKRSTALYRERWSEQTAGIVTTTVIAWFVSLPFAALLIAAIATRGSLGAILFVAGGAGLIAIGAFDTAINQVFRVFLYRNVIGLDAAGVGPFSLDDFAAAALATKASSSWNLAQDPNSGYGRDRVGSVATRHYYGNRF